MKIQGIGSTNPIETAAAEGKAKTVQAKTAQPVDSVQLSIGSAGESFDTAKVEAIKAAIAAGTFKVNPEAIADKLIAGVQDLLAPRH